ncbi:hypothetical protein KSP9073_00776 [Kushneria phyllosphaerae]|uniref:Uncharacterized protein n=1 Tax=Kushneria phyllosphaerae TaxID=2100822 RepID=A0A2R8CIP3_9GAMM|nr:hypothetical protein KSP9073_00776 [Kushneria phyllosphaerae]
MVSADCAEPSLASETTWHPVYSWQADTSKEEELSALGT